MYDFDHIARQHHQDILRWTQQDQLACEVEATQRRQKTEMDLPQRPASLNLVTAWLMALRKRRAAANVTQPAFSVSNPSTFLRERLREDSNREMDWLWAASQLSAPEEIRYCLERALYINPDNLDIQNALSQLVARHAEINEAQPVNQHSFAHISDR